MVTRKSTKNNQTNHSNNKTTITRVFQKGHKSHVKELQQPPEKFKENINIVYYGPKYKKKNKS